MEEWVGALAGSPMQKNRRSPPWELRQRQLPTLRAGWSRVRVVRTRNKQFTWNGLAVAQAAELVSRIEDDSPQQLPPG